MIKSDSSRFYEVTPMYVNRVRGNARNVIFSYMVQNYYTGLTPFIGKYDQVICNL
jgi:hypothetical protein